MIFALFGVLIVLGVFILFAVVAVKGLGAKREMDALEQGIAAGHVPELCEWSPSLLEWLSCDVVGSSYYFRPMGGARTEKLAITVPAWQGPATLLALSAEHTERRGEGRIEVLAKGWRVSLVRHGAAWLVSVNGAAFGAIDEASGHLFDARQAPVGARVRGAGGTQLQLRGVDVAAIAPDAKIHAQRPETRRPLLRMAAPLTEVEPVMWLLAVIGLELGMRLREGGMMV